MLDHTPISGAVLIIENDRVLRDIIVELLGFGDVCCWDTHSGYEGITLFEHHQDEIDLVIMDMVLGDKNGVEMVEELEALQPDINIIIISGLEKAELDETFIGHTNIFVVQKPFDMLWFLDTVKHQLGN